MVFAAQEAGLQLALVHPGLRGQHAAQQRLLAHFQAEDGHDGLVLIGRVLRDVDGQRGFAHGGTGGDDDQLALLQAAGHAVELGEIGGQAGDFAALLVEIVDGAEGVLDDLVERLEALREALLADLQQLRLGGVEDIEGGLALVGGAGDGRRADAHELAQQALVLDDADVLFDDRAARQTLGERGQIGHAADGLDLFVAGQLVGQRDDVDGALGVDQLAHAQEDAAMRVEREVVGFEVFGGLGVGRVVQQDGAEDGLLGVDIRGQSGVESEIGDRGHVLLHILRGGSNTATGCDAGSGTRAPSPAYPIVVVQDTSKD